MRFSLLAIALLAAGCSSGPRAPALIDSPVYENDREGFRFLVPDGWKMSARGELPAGPQAKERLLVQFHRAGGSGEPATMEVSAADLPAGANLEEYLSGPSFGVRHWSETGHAASVTTQGADGERRAFRAKGPQAPAKEVVAFRRKERVYLFTLVFADADGSARDQFRRAVGSLIWK